MPVSTELANTTYTEIGTELQNGLVRRIALWDRLIKGLRTPQESGTYIDRPFAGGAPARGVGIFIGDELLNMTRRQQIRLLRVEGHRIVVAINIPNKELRMNDGKRGAVKLMEAYPKTVLELAAVDINTYMLTSASANHVFSTEALRGFVTLDGTDSSGVGLGVTNGILDFQPPANQSDTTHNVAKSSAIGHYNQHVEIGAWSSGGQRKLRELYRLCASHNGRANSGPDLAYFDADLYANFESDRFDLVRLRTIEDKTEKSTTLEFMGFAGMHIEYDPALVRSAFTASPQSGATVAPSSGLGYMLDTNLIEMPTWEVPNATPFERRVGDQDVVTSTWAGQWQLIFNRLPAHGTVVGGGI